MKKLFDAYFNQKYSVDYNMNGKIYTTIILYEGVGIHSLSTNTLLIYPSESEPDTININVTPGEDRVVIGAFLNYLSVRFAKPLKREIIDTFAKTDKGLMTINLNTAFDEPTAQSTGLTSFDDMLICLYACGIPQKKECINGRENTRGTVGSPQRDCD